MWSWGERLTEIKPYEPDMTRKILLAGLLVPVVVFYKKIIVLGCIAVGAVFFPEASQALRHYCFGDGSELRVDPEYIKTSPVVRKHLAGMKVGDRKKVGFHQWEDWRLSFALNPFTIEKRKDKVVVTQWMEFDRKGDVTTLLFFIPIKDNLVHTFDCTPYMFRSEWAY
jgi:hypothetical protein